MAILLRFAGLDPLGTHARLYQLHRQPRQSRHRPAGGRVTVAAVHRARQAKLIYGVLSILTRLLLKRGTYKSVANLQDTIGRDIREHRKTPKPSTLDRTLRMSPGVNGIFNWKIGGNLAAKIAGELLPDLSCVTFRHHVGSDGVAGCDRVQDIPVLAVNDMVIVFVFIVAFW